MITRTLTLISEHGDIPVEIEIFDAIPQGDDFACEILIEGGPFNLRKKAYGVEFYASDDPRTRDGTGNYLFSRGV